MYDEFERALTGKTPRKGPSSLAWIAIGLVLVLVAGAAGVGYGVSHVKSRVRHIAREVHANSLKATGQLVSSLERSGSLATLDPQHGLSFLESLDSGDPAQALVRKVVGKQLDAPQDIQALADRSGDAERHSATVRTDDEDVSIQLSRSEHGGSLVLDSRDGRVRFNLEKNSQGGSLSIDSDDGHARFDLIRGDDGARLVIHGDDNATVELAVGAQSRSTPGWVPRPHAMPDDTRPVFSLTTADAKLGAVTWEDDASPGAWISMYRSTLEDAGYEVQVEQSRSGPRHDEASLWARRERDGRTVFALARQQEDGRTHEVLGYGEGDATDR